MRVDSLFLETSMPAIISFISQKGGVGKSTLARALAREAAASGLLVKLADLDIQQSTSCDWNRVRLGAKINPVLSVQSYATAAQALAEAAAFDLLVIDGPARTTSGTLDIARASNIVVQPTGASADDLRPAVREFHGLVKAGIPKERLVFALNRIGTDAEMTESLNYIAQAGYEALKGFLSERPAYRKAQNAGFSVTETRYDSLNARADDLLQALIDKVSGYEERIDFKKPAKQIGRSAVNG
jgi:chromosome partitioning protein